MASSNDGKRSEILGEIEASIQKADSYVKKYKRLDFWLTLINIISITFATALAGGAAAAGAPVASTMGGWRTTCLIVAICSLVGTISGTAYIRYRVGEQHAKGMACKAKLVAVKLNSDDRASAEVKKEYQHAYQEYPEILA
jgi:hypothetical protein